MIYDEPLFAFTNNPNKVLPSFSYIIVQWILIHYSDQTDQKPKNVQYICDLLSIKPNKDYTAFEFWLSKKRASSLLLQQKEMNLIKFQRRSFSFVTFIWTLYIKTPERLFKISMLNDDATALFISSSSYTTFLAAFSSIYTFCSAPLWSTNDNKGDTTRNPEQMFENWKLGFPIGSVQPPVPTTSSASEHNSKFLPRERRRNCFHFHFC